MALNKIIIQGRLVKDVELRQTQSGVDVCSLTLAVDRDFKDANGNKVSDFIDCVLWRKTAEFAAKYFRKGDMAIIEGSLQSRKWQDKQGNNRVSWEVQANSIYFCGGRKDGTQTAGSPVNVEADDYDAAPEPKLEEIEDDGELPF